MALSTGKEESVLKLNADKLNSDKIILSGEAIYKEGVLNVGAAIKCGTFLNLTSKAGEVNNVFNVYVRNPRIAIVIPYIQEGHTKTKTYDDGETVYYALPQRGAQVQVKIGEDFKSIGHPIRISTGGVAIPSTAHGVGVDPNKRTYTVEQREGIIGYALSIGQKDEWAIIEIV